MHIEFIGVENGPLMVYKAPEPGERYIMGIDTATGVGKDFTVFQVFNARMPFEQVAVYRVKESVVDAAEAAHRLGTWYNEAMIVCETNYPGNAVQDALVMKYRYPNNYQAEEHLDEDPNISCKFGFQTNQASKWMLIREFEEVLKSKDIILHDKQTIEEFMQYVYIEDRTKTGAVQGLNDDCVIAAMLAIHGCTLFPRRPKPKPKTQKEGNAQHRALMDKFIAGILRPEHHKPTVL